MRGTDTEWQELCEYYLGNPDIIELLIPTIRDFCSNDLGIFLAQKEARLATVRQFFLNQFDLLPPFERDCLVWLALACEPLKLSACNDDRLLPSMAVSCWIHCCRCSNNI